MSELPAEGLMAERRPAALLRLLRWQPTAQRPGRRHTAWQTQRVNNLVMQNISRQTMPAPPDTEAILGIQPKAASSRSSERS